VSILNDRVIAITGAGRGLGRAYAFYLARRGAKIVVNDNGCALDGSDENPTIAQAVVDEIRQNGGDAIAHTESISSSQGAESLIRQAVGQYGRIDVLVNNAGILRDQALLELDDADWHAVIDSHLHGTFYCTRAAARKMVDQDEGGVIINTTSFAGIRGNAGQVNYAAAKGGILGLTKALAFELSALSIRVNAIAPIADTRMTEGNEVAPDEMSPEHAAPLVAFLASPLAEGLSGRVFGAHGRRIFEYRTLLSAGAVDNAEPTDVSEALSAISAFDAPLPHLPLRDDGPFRARCALERLAEVIKPRRAKRFVGALDIWLCGHSLRDDVVRAEVEVNQGSCGLTIKEADDRRYDSERLDGARPMIRIDAATFLALASGTMTLPQAFVHGRLDTNNFAESMRFFRLFELGKLESLLGEDRSSSDGV
jgi:NAD(P)-dependent dehydrogenase (short-subunit alcohol dehydrogenase family)